MQFTQEEIKAAKAMRDEIIDNNISELKSIYMAGEIVMWDKIHNKNQISKSLYLSDDEWFATHEAFVTAMKIDGNKTTYEHLQNAFYWFKERFNK